MPLKITKQSCQILPQSEQSLTYWEPSGLDLPIGPELGALLAEGRKINTQFFCQTTSITCYRLQYTSIRCHTGHITSCWSTDRDMLSCVPIERIIGFVPNMGRKVEEIVKAVLENLIWTLLIAEHSHTTTLQLCLAWIPPFSGVCAMLSTFSKFMQ